MDWLKIGKETLIAAVFGGVTCVVFLGIRYTIWSKNLPKGVSKFRWLIAIGIGAILFVIELPLGLISEKSASINAGVIYLIGICLKDNPSV